MTCAFCGRELPRDAEPVLVPRHAARVDAPVGELADGVQRYVPVHRACVFGSGEAAAAS